MVFWRMTFPPKHQQRGKSSIISQVGKIKPTEDRYPVFIFFDETAAAFCKA